MRIRIGNPFKKTQTEYISDFWLRFFLKNYKSITEVSYLKNHSVPLRSLKQMYKLNISSCFVEAKIKKINLFLTKTVVSLESCKNILFSTFLSQYRMKTNAN